MPEDGKRFTRRSFLKHGTGLAISLSALSTLPIVGCGQQTAPAASAPPSSAPASAPPSPSPSAAAPALTATPDAKAKLAQLYEAAKKEGEVLWYTTHSVPDAEKRNQDFMDRYPGIKAQFWRNTSESIFDKVTTEIQSGRSSADIIFVGVPGFGELKPLLKPYKIQSDADYTPQFKDPEGLWITNYLMPMAPTYNSSMVKPSEAPKSWEDLLDPRWKGKISLEQSDSTWMLGMMKFWGRDKALDYMKKLAQQDLQLRKSHLTQLDLLAAGEFAIVVCGYLYYAEQLKAKGATLEWLRINPTITSTINYGLNAKAAHPNAGMLLMEYMFSQEGQQLVAKMGSFPGMFNKVPPTQRTLLEPKDNFVPVTPAMYKEQDEADKLFQEIFWPKA